MFKNINKWLLASAVMVSGLVPAFAQADKAAASKENYNPNIWQLEYKGRTSYLFGSIHLGDASMYPLPEKISAAFAASDTLVVEADISKVDQNQMAVQVQKMAFDPKNPLKTQISEKTNKQYDQYCEATKSPCAMFQMVEPWFAAINLEAMAVMRAGYSEQYGIDKHFLTNAKDKAVVELESVDMQLKLLDEMPARSQELMLLGATMRNTDDINEFFTAWKTGQLESAMEQAEQETLDLGIAQEDIDQLNEVFLYERNRGMADGVDKLLKEGKSLFVVVGAAHYIGEKSVISYLEEKGYKVQSL